MITLKSKPVVWLKKVFPGIYFWLRYYYSIRKLGNQAEKRSRLLQELIAESADKKCLQIGVKDAIGAKHGTNWTSVDLYDTSDYIDYNYDIHDLKFEDATFDVAICTSILEHVDSPTLAIQELNRVLKPGGKIWVQLPFCYPYHEGPNDFWRASPGGLRIWMRDFEEITCGAFKFTRSPLALSSFFYGRKKQDDDLSQV